MDSDVHNYPDSIADLLPFLPARWQVYVRQAGFTNPSVSHYPKVFSQAARRDAWPPGGRKPGSDPAFARQQLLDAWDIDYAILNPLYGLCAVHNLDLGNALMRAVNDWTAACWLDHDPRWRGSIVLNPHDPEAAAGEIARLAGDRRFVQALLLVRSHAPYRPAAVPAHLPRRLRSGTAGGHPLWRQRPTHHPLRLALLLHRGPHRHVPGLRGPGH